MSITDAARSILDEDEAINHPHQQQKQQYQILYEELLSNYNQVKAENRRLRKLNIQLQEGV